MVQRHAGHPRLPLPLCSAGWWTGPFPYDDFTWPRVENGVLQVVDVYATTGTVDAALARLSEAPEPWLCSVAFHASHAPFQAPPADLSSSGLPPGGFAVGDPRPWFAAMVEAMDTELGRLLDTLDVLSPGLRGRTNVIFPGDNGTPGEVTSPPFKIGHAKGTLHEGGVNVPLIVAGPAVPTPGGECAALVSTVDLLPALADLAGLATDQLLPDVLLDGASLVPFLVDPALPGRPRVFTEQDQPHGVLPVCQLDTGLGGPGQVTLSVSGEALFAGAEATLRVAGAPPRAPVFLLGSTGYAPTPLLADQLAAYQGLVDFLEATRGEP